MRILLQHARNKLYFRSGNIWTSNPDAAFDFQHSQDLYEFVETNNLQDVQLVVKFANPLQFEVVPIEVLASANPSRQ
jgi:hypothetical protein